MLFIQHGVHASTKFLEFFFSNLLLETDYELKNRYLHVDYAADEKSQSANSEFPKCQFGTLECSLEEIAILEQLVKNPNITQKELVKQTGKSLRTVKRLMEALQAKNYINRVNGKRYGTWEVVLSPSDSKD